MSSRQDRTAALMSSQRSWLPAQVREHPSMEEEGVHEFAFLTEEMWRTDGFWGKATQLFFLRVWLLVGRPLTQEYMERTS